MLVAETICLADPPVIMLPHPLPKSIRLEVADPFEANIQFDEALEKAGIDYAYSEFDGDAVIFHGLMYAS
jgi:hypothetical protein